MRAVVRSGKGSMTKTNRDDVTRGARRHVAAIGGHACTTGRTLDYQQAARAADRSGCKWLISKGIVAPKIATEIRP